ncbi:DUF2336 domain-containing protein [Maricaulis sp.]|uniref:DUF2336 domain-containing protein n=1 Tax=Maricaulis sp. TaxID=1486257 RepID=UPI003A949B0E
MANAEPFELIDEAPRRARNVLARRLTDIVGLPSSRLTPRERWIVADLLYDILRASDVPVRQRCARRLAGLLEAPGRLLRVLACDRYEIAQPILEESRALTDFDLLEIVQSGSLQHRMAIARRENISEIISAALVAAGEAPVVECVLKNQTTSLAAPTLDRLVGAAQDETRYARLLIRRPELRPSQAFRLFWDCEHTERVQILERFAVDRTILIDSTEDIFPMVSAEDGDDPLVTRVLRYIDRRQRNREAAELSPHGSLEGAIDAFAAEGGQVAIVEEIATLAAIHKRLLLRMMDDMAGEPLAILCKATGLKWSNFHGLWTGLGRHGQDDSVELARKVHDSLSVEKAQTVLRYWNLSVEDADKR